MDNKEYQRRWRNKQKANGKKQISIYLDDQTLKQFKQLAESNNKTQKRILEESIETRLFLTKTVNECIQIAEQCKQAYKDNLKDLMGDNIPLEEIQPDEPEEQINVIKDILSEMTKAMIEDYGQRSVNEVFQRITPKSKGTLQDLKPLEVKKKILP